jgi:uncharacterized protein (DUF433 family)
LRPFIIARLTARGVASLYETARRVPESRNHGGTPVFCGTRVPIQTLLDYLEAGDTIGDFLEGFPSVTRQQVIAFLEEAKDRLVESVG